MPESDLKVVPAEIGGGFGGKLVIYMEPLALAAGQKDRPSGEIRDEPGRGAARHRADLGLLDQG